MYFLIFTNSTPRYASNRYVWVRSPKTLPRTCTERVSVLVPKLKTTEVPITSRADELRSLRTRGYYRILFTWGSKTSKGKRQWWEWGEWWPLLFGMKTDKWHGLTRWLESYSLWPRLSHLHGSVRPSPALACLRSLSLLDRWGGLLMPAALGPFRWLGGICVMLCKSKSALTSVILRLTLAVAAGGWAWSPFSTFPVRRQMLAEVKGPDLGQTHRTGESPSQGSYPGFCALWWLHEGVHFMKMKQVLNLWSIHNSQMHIILQ